jgi:hypothetical protein
LSRFGGEGSQLLTSQDACQEPLEGFPVCGLTFPDYEHFPPGGAEPLRVLPVAPFVSAYLRQPVIAVRLRFSAAISALRAAVPEAAMDKHAHSPAGQNQIRLSRKRRDVKPVSQSVRV